MISKTKNVLKLAAAGAVAVSALTFNAQALAELEVAASAAVASKYLFRGVDLGAGSSAGDLGLPAVSGSLQASSMGFYAGVWGSSGDVNAGSEMDLYVGYNKQLGDFSYGISAITYYYPSAPEANSTGMPMAQNLDDLGGLSEVVLSLGYGPASFSYTDNVAGATGYAYYTLGATLNAFSATLGMHSVDTDDSDMTHLDLSYAYNKNLSFTLSQVVDQGDKASYDEDLNFVVTYSLPIDL